MREYGISPRVDGNWLELEPMLVTLRISSPNCPSYNEKRLHLHFSSITKCFRDRQRAWLTETAMHYELCNIHATIRYRVSPVSYLYTCLVSLLRVFATVRANGFPQKWHPWFVFRTAVPIRGSNSNATPPSVMFERGLKGTLRSPLKCCKFFFKKPCAISLKHILCNNKNGFLGHHMQPRLWSSTLTFRRPVTNFRIREFKCLSPTDKISSTVIFETMRPIPEH
jgi:hypothetical protein